jgi:hypothetical protein
MELNSQLDLKLIPTELKLLLDFIKCNNEKKLCIDVSEYQKIDWDFFLKLAVHHRIYPLIYSSVRNFTNTDLIPSYVIQTITKLYKRNTFQMLYLCSEMEYINNLCSENQIRVLFLKGPILANDLYEDLSLRTSVDLDILISFADLAKMENLIIKSGYVKDDYIETVLNDWKWRHHHITFNHPEKGIKLEIHWRLNPGPGVEPTFNELWSRKKISTITSSPSYLLGHEDLFLFLVTHGSRHGWSRLRWLIDIDRITKQIPDWCKIYRQLKKFHYLNVGGQSLVLAEQLLNTPTNNEWIKKMMKGNRARHLAQQAVFYFEKMVNLHTDPVPEDVSNYHKRHLFSLMSNYQKLFFILSFFYPYPDDAKTLPLPKILHFLYFPLRPVLWAWRKTKSHALP